ncbi:MAG TPA: hypothetical protein VFQ91_21245 [Bryobacteraceae bacterium]|nr:hypothetical protein [Bryobacteraceae bacterium]
MTPRSLLIRQAFFGLFHSEALSEAGVENYRTWIISAVSRILCKRILHG